MLVACDLQRPNAVTQLQVVGERAGVPVFAPHPGATSTEPTTRPATRSPSPGPASRKPAARCTTS